MNNNNKLLPCDGWENAVGTGYLNCKCGSWKKHWLNYSGATEWPTYCRVKGCTNRAEYGLHVRNTKVSRTVYIVPGCDQCNHRTDTFSLKENTKLALSNQSETCNK